MKTTLFQYRRPDDREIQDWVDRALIVLDTSTLFSLFKVAESRQRDIIGVLRSVEGRLWLPYQVGIEFERGLIEAERDYRKEFQDLIQTVQSSRTTVQNALDPGRFGDWPKEVVESFRASCKGLIDEIKRKKGDLARAASARDAVHALFQGRIAEPPARRASVERKQEAARRRGANEPPGFNDGTPGDYLIWCEMIAEAKLRQLPLIFVTNDVKDDWWLRADDAKLQPHPDLRLEFFQETGQMYWSFTFENFLEILPTSSLSPDAIAEVARVTLERRPVPGPDNPAEWLRFLEQGTGWPRHKLVDELLEWGHWLREEDRLRAEVGGALTLDPRYPRIAAMLGLALNRFEDALDATWRSSPECSSGQDAGDWKTHFHTGLFAGHARLRDPDGTQFELTLMREVSAAAATSGRYDNTTSQIMMHLHVLVHERTELFDQAVAVARRLWDVEQRLARYTRDNPPTTWTSEAIPGGLNSEIRSLRLELEQLGGASNDLRGFEYTERVAAAARLAWLLRETNEEQLPAVLRPGS